MRTKQDYVLNQKDGKYIPEKVGLKSVQRDGVDYEFTLVFDIDIKHFATSSKDRTGLFMGKPDFTISEETGRQILEWCNSADTNSINDFSHTKDKDMQQDIISKILQSKTIAELLAVYKAYPEYQNDLMASYNKRKSELMNIPITKTFQPMEYTDNLTLQPVQQRYSSGNIMEGQGNNLIIDDDSGNNEGGNLKPVFSKPVQDAEVYYPSRMNEDSRAELLQVQPILMDEGKTKDLVDSSEHKPFIIANTVEASLDHLKNDCIIPVFSKDNEKTIAHQEFIDTIYDNIQHIFPYQSIASPEIRVSHQIKGRTPDAIHLSVKDLQDYQKTIYYERMAFIIRIPSITNIVNGNKLCLCIGGVRSYNLENLYNKKSLEKFKIFIGFQNQVCMNLCVWSDGFVDDIRVASIVELQRKALEMMQNYNAELHLMEMKELSQDYLTEHQFAQLIGKARLYQHLPKSERIKLPELNFNDSHINTMAKDYYEDKNFCRNEDGRINLWDGYYI